MQNFWNTISKYPIFLAGALLSVFLSAFKPLLPFFKHPVSAIALIGAFIGGFAFLAFTLRAMLGLQSF
ncbi:Protein of unknown function (DUF751) [Leptolyngbyaceae cyanobacterium JSC-12]|nr:Protein of unknown function (DUF751) [Leptolyngbyaceae cyanobacterium JSC-12]